MTGREELWTSRKGRRQGRGNWRVVSTRRHTYESGGVVVTGGLSITIGFQYRVSLNDLVFQGALEEAGWWKTNRKHTHARSVREGGRGRRLWRPSSLRRLWRERGRAGGVCWG